MASTTGHHTTKLSDLHDCCHQMASYTRQLFCDTVRRGFAIETPHRRIPGSLTLDMISDAEHIATIAAAAFRNQSEIFSLSLVKMILMSLAFVQRESLGMWQIMFQGCLLAGLSPKQALRKLSPPHFPLARTSLALRHIWISLPQ